MTRRSGRAGSFRNDDGAASAIEFAFVAPVLIVLLAGIVAYGIYFGASHSVQQLAADAARASVVGLSEAERRAIAVAEVDASADSYPFLRRQHLTVSAAATSDPNLFEVRIVYDASHLAVWALDGLVPLPSPTIEHAAVIRRGGY